MRENGSYLPDYSSQEGGRGDGGNQLEGISLRDEDEEVPFWKAGGLGTHVLLELPRGRTIPSLEWGEGTSSVHGDQSAH